MQAKVLCDKKSADNLKLTYYVLNNDESMTGIWLLCYLPLPQVELEVLQILLVELVRIFLHPILL